MPGYAPIHPIVGVQPFNELLVADTTQRNQLDMVCDAVDPYFGYGRFIYLKSGAAMNPGRLVMISDETFVTADLANTANLGHPFAVARTVYDAASEFGWFQFEGVCPVQTAASVAAGAAVGIGAAGQAGTNSAGKQLLSTRVLRASTFTLTKTGVLAPFGNTKQIGVPNVDGLFYGLAVSGTGVAASTTITGLDPSGRFITVNNAITAPLTTITVTFTYTGFLLVHINSPFGQGAIT